MEVFLERLLFELLIIAAQIALLRLLDWLRGRRGPADAPLVAVAA
jgi:hypothetical protein